MSGARPPRGPIVRAILALGGAALPLLGACGSPGASYPDGSQVTAAQASWCQGLAKLSGNPTGWEHMNACKGAFPTASAAFLKNMTKCFVTRHEAAGDNAVDNSQIVSDCTDEATVNMPNDEAGGRELIAARCARAERCEKVKAADCKAGIDKLEGAQRALITTRFNAAGQHDIASCLSSKSCSDNEEEAQDACYKPVSEKLLWFPN